MANKKYTTEEDNILTVMWNAGNSIKQIAGNIGRSEKSVSNRKCFLKLPFRSKSKPASIPLKKEKFKGHDFNYPDEPGSVSLIDLKPHQCHFPCNGQMYCGEPNNKSHGYCTRHHKIMWKKPSKLNY